MRLPGEYSERSSTNIDKEICIAICTRWSGKVSAGARAKAGNLHARVTKQLRMRHLLKDAENAVISNVYRCNIGLWKPLPTIRFENSPLVKDLLRPLLKARSRARIIFVTMGIDDLSSNEASLVAYYERRQMNMRLKLSILMTAHEIQYHSKLPAWEAENWVGPILNRFGLY